MTKCEIENDVDGMPQWISGELFTGSGKKYKDLKEKQVLVFSERIGYLLLCRMDRLRQNAFYAGTSKDYTAKDYTGSPCCLGKDVVQQGEPVLSVPIKLLNII